MNVEWEAQAPPVKSSIGFTPTAGFWFLKADKGRKVLGSSCNSTMSRTRWSNRRINVRLCGRFLEWLANRTREVSFFVEKNSIPEASSKG